MGTENLRKGSEPWNATKINSSASHGTLENHQMCETRSEDFSLFREMLKNQSILRKKWPKRCRIKK